MREIGEIELAIQGGTEKIEQLGSSCFSHHILRQILIITLITYR